MYKYDKLTEAINFIKYEIFLEVSITNNKVRTDFNEVIKCDLLMQIISRYAELYTLMIVLEMK